MVLAVSVTPDGQNGVSAGYDKTLIVWDLHTGQQLRVLRGHKKAVSIALRSRQMGSVWSLAAALNIR